MASDVEARHIIVPGQTGHKGVPFVAVVIAFLGVILGCGQFYRMGQLIADGQPLVFAAQPETTFAWSLEVMKGNKYTVEVKPMDVSNVYNFARVIVCDGLFDLCPDGSQIGSTTGTDHGARLSFIAAESGMVYIHVSASLAEKGENAGRYQIVIYEE